MRDAKSDRSDYINYRGISFLSVVGKIVVSIYPESQYGFRTGRSTIYMIFSVRQLQEKCREQRRPLYVVNKEDHCMSWTKKTTVCREQRRPLYVVNKEDHCMSWTKKTTVCREQRRTTVFGRIRRLTLFAEMDCSSCWLLSVISSFHDDMKGTINYDGATSEPFEIRSRVKQGCVLATTLFGIFVSLMLLYTFGPSTEVVNLHTKTDGKLFNVARLRAKTQLHRVLIR